jgi:hypothetical protein
VQQLTGLDAAFLAMETPTVFGHVGSVSVVDPSTAPEPLTLERFTRVVESRLPLVPLLRRRLVDVPLGLDQPYWIEDPDFDIEFHVRELALPSTGSDRQLAEQAARLHARPLDRSRPLWEIYLIFGLQGGRRSTARCTMPPSTACRATTSSPHCSTSRPRVARCPSHPLAGPSGNRPRPSCSPAAPCR